VADILPKESKLLQTGRILAQPATVWRQGVRRY